MMNLKKQRLAKAIKIAQITWCGALFVPYVSAAPTGGAVTSGVANITQDSASLTAVDISSDFAEISWETFDIETGEVVDFNFNSSVSDPSSGIVVNTVLQAGSSISGALTSNGHVVLINPRGVLFNDGASVDVGALTVSALGGTISGRDGSFALDFDDSVQSGVDGLASGTIINSGTILADRGITLIGRSIQNLTTDGGVGNARIESATINLVAADAVTISLDSQSDLYGVQVNTSALADELIVNGNGSVISGATVLMTATASDALTATAVNNEGTIQAQGIDLSGGVVRLTGSGGSVVNTGTIQVSADAGAAETVAAGSVSIQADDITQSGAISASAVTDRSGGNITLTAEDSLVIGGTISSSGSGSANTGGTVVTTVSSPTGQLELSGTQSPVNTVGQNGAASGSWEIAADRLVVAEVTGDPAQDCGSGCIDGALITDALADNAAVIITASGTGNATGISIRDRVTWSSDSALALKSEAAIEVQNFINGQGQSELAGGNLSIVAETGFSNLGSISVSDFSLLLGGSGSDTSSQLGDLSYSGEFAVAGGSGFDSVSFEGIAGSLEFTATDSSTISLNDGSALRTLTDIEAVVADTSDTLAGTSAEDTFTLLDTNAVQSNGISFTGIGTLDGGDGDDTLIGESGVAWSLADLEQGEQNSIALTDVEILQANDASLAGVSNGEQFSVTADSEVTLTGLSGFRFTNLSAIDVTGISNVSLDATALGSQGLFLQDSTGTLSTEAILGDGIDFSGFSSVQVSALDAAAIGSSALYFRNNSGTSLSTAAGSGVLFNGLSSVTAAALDSNGFVVDLTLGALSGQVSSAAGAVAFSGVETLQGGDGASITGGGSWSLGADGRAAEGVTGITLDGAWNVTTAANGILTDAGSNNAFTLDAGDVSIAGSQFVFSGLGSVTGGSGSSLNALSLGNDFLYLTDAAGTVSTEQGGSGITFADFSSISVSNLDTVTLTGGELYLRNIQGTSASTGATTGTLFSGLEEVAVNLLHTNGFAIQFDIDGTASVRVQSGGPVFNQLTEVTGGSGAVIAGGTSWALDLDGDTTEAVSGITFSNGWTVNTAANAVLTGTDTGDTFTLNSDGDVETGSNLIFSGLASVVGGAGPNSLVVSNSTVDLSNGNVVTVESESLEFENISIVSGDDNSVLNAQSLSDSLYLTDAIGSVSTVAGGAAGGVDFSGFGEIQVASIDATAIGTSGLYFRNNSGSTLSTVAQDGTIFSGLSAVVSQVLHSNGFTVDLTLGSLSGEVSSSAVEFTGVSNLAGSSGAAVSGGNNWTLGSTGTATESDTGIELEGNWAVNTATGATLTDSGSGSEFSLSGDDVSIVNSGLLFSNLGFVAGVAGSTLNALSLNDEPLYLTDAFGTVSTASNGSGIEFSNFSGISVVHLDAVTAVAGDLYLRNAAGTSVSTGAASGTLFSSLEQVSVTRLHTNGLATNFDIAGNASIQVQGGGTAFNQLSEVVGGNGAQIFDSGNWTLDVAGGARENASDILFSGLWFVDATGGSLEGTANVDIFSLNSSGELEVGTLTFSGLASVSGGSDIDTLDATGFSEGVQLESGNSSVTTAGILFDEIETVETVAVTGADTGTAFTLAGGSVTVDGSDLNFVGIETVDGGSASSSLDATSLGATPLYLLDAADSLVSTVADGSGGISFSNFGGISVSQLDATALGSTALYLRDNTGAQVSTARTGGTVISGLSAVQASSLDTNGNVVSLSITGAGSVATNAVTFSNVAEFSGGDSASVSGGTGWSLLTGGAVEESSSAIDFSGDWIVEAAGLRLSGTGNDDTFVLNADGSVEAAEVTFRNLTSVLGGGGQDTLIDQAGTAGYVLLERNRISVAGVDISGLSEVIATGSGVLDASGYADGMWLTGVNGEVATASVDGLTFSGMASVTSATITGSNIGESYTVNDSGAVSVLEVLFDGVAEVIAGSTNSQVTAAAGSDWELIPEGVGGVALESAVSTDGIRFTEFTQLTSQSAGLVGTLGVDAFTLTGSDATGQIVGFGEMEFSGLASVTGSGGTDSLDAMGYDSSVFLTGSDRELQAGELMFAGFSTAQMTSLTSDYGTVGDNGGVDSFSVIADNTLTVAGMTISALTNVSTDGSDIVDTNAAVTNVTGSGFDTQGIHFSRVALVSGELIEGTTGDDEFSISASGVISLNTQALGLFSRVDTLAGVDTITGSAGQDWTITGLNSASSQGVDFVNIEQLVIGDAGLIGAADAEVFSLFDDGSVQVGGILAEGMAYIDGGDGGVIDQLDASGFASGLQLTGTDSLLLAGELEVRGFETAISPLLLGSGTGDVFALSDSGLVAGGITFSGLSSVSGGGGSDRLDSSLDRDWLLGSEEGAFRHADIDFAGIETATGGSGALQGGAADSDFVLGNGVLRAHAVDFEGVTSIDAGTGRDSVATEAGLAWSLDGTAGSAVVDGVSFRGIEDVSTADARLDTSGAAGALVFELSSNGAQVSILDILFSSVSSVVASDAAVDTVVSGTDQWQLQASQNSIVANGVLFSGIDSVEGDAAELVGTAVADEFRLGNGSNSLVAAGIAFSGIEQVSGTGGSDILVGTSNDDTFSLEANGDIRTAAMLFTGVTEVDGGAGTDVVDGTAASWTSSTDASGLVSGSALGTVNSLTVVFENLERVENTGQYTGPAVADDYRLSGPTSLTMGGIEFAGLQTLAAGSGSNTLYGVDANMTWRLGSDQGTVSDGQSSLVFSGFDAIVAGSGADQFELGDTVLASLDTGAGDDIVLLQQAQISQLSLGADNDVLVVASAAQPLDVVAGSGEDRLQINVAGQSWLINGDTTTVNSVGAVDFTGFESLEDTGGGLDLNTGLAFDFYGSAEQGTAGIEFTTAGMTLAYDPSGDLNLVSGTASTIGGELFARNADLTLAGDLDIVSDVEALTISSTAGDIDASIIATGDLILGQVDVGRGHLSLLTSSVGELFAESIDDLHIRAGSVELGSGDMRWENIGTASVPLRVDISGSLDIVAFNFYEPIFEGGFPVVTTTGEGIPSLISAQASQGLKSAVQHPTEDIAQLDPGIFDEVTPYSLGINTLNAPEMRLTENGLQSAEEDDEEEEEQHTDMAPAAGE